MKTKALFVHLPILFFTIVALLSVDIAVAQESDDGNMMFLPFLVSEQAVHADVSTRLVTAAEEMSYKFDFGTSSSRVGNGWTRVTPDTNTSIVSWSGARVRAVDRGGAGRVNSTNRDLVYGSGTTNLNLNVGNGTWKVTMKMGDRTAAHDNMIVKAEGETINNDVDNRAGQFVNVGRGASGGSQSFEIDVNDGVLNIELSDGGGSNRHWVLTRLVLERLDNPSTPNPPTPNPPTPNPPSGLDSYEFDFGTNTSPVQSGWTQVTPSTNNSIVTWSGATVSAVDRGAITSGGFRPNPDADRDLVYGAGTTSLNLNVGNGNWLVIMEMGDPSFAHDNMVVKAEGLLINGNVSNSAGGVATVGLGFSGSDAFFNVNVTDGVLNIEFSDEGGSNPHWVLPRLSVSRVDSTPDAFPAYAQVRYNFDFGTDSSPVESGWNRISLTSRSWFSWAGAEVSAVDRGSANGVNNVNRDLVYGSGTTSLNFSVPTGSIWRVTMNMGDRSYAHDNMIVKAEGQIINNDVDNAVGQFPFVGQGTSGGSQTFDVAVNDEVLNIELSDGGGSNRHWVLNRLSLEWVGNDAGLFSSRP